MESKITYCRYWCAQVYGGQKINGYLAGNGVTGSDLMGAVDDDEEGEDTSNRSERS